MNLSSIPLIGLLQHRLTFFGERQAAITKNIANADTPKFLPQDVRDPLVTSGTSGIPPLPMAATHPSHISGMVPASSFVSFQSGKASDVSPAGNGVVLSQEAMKLTENNMDHQTATGIYRKIAELFRLAGSGNR